MGKQKKKKSGEIKLFLTKDAKTKKKGYGDSRKREREKSHERLDKGGRGV